MFIFVTIVLIIIGLFCLSRGIDRLKYYVNCKRNEKYYKFGQQRKES